MSKYPSESSLLVNATQQQLSQSGFKAGMAVIPSPHEEATGGYDIEFNTATRLELQYKAVYSEIDDRTFEPGTHQPAVKFPFYADQARTLYGRAVEPGIIFYALPVVTNLSGLGDVLGSTVFIDIRAFKALPKSPEEFQEYTAFWVPIRNSPSAAKPTPTFSAVYLKDKTEDRYSLPRAYHRIDSQYLYTWPEIRRFTQSHITGVPVRLHGNPTPTAGYEALANFESSLLKSRFPQSILDEQRQIQPTDWDLFEDVVNSVHDQSINVSNALRSDRPSRDELFDLELYDEIIETREYLLATDQDQDHRRAAIRAALLNHPDDSSDEERPTPDYSGLDPRENSQYRQYRYLTWGEETDPLTAPIGFP